MKKHDNNIDEFLAEILKEGALEEPENRQYTPMLMNAVYAHDHKKEKIKQLIFGVMGIMIGLSLITGLVFFWQSGLLGQWAVQLRDYLRNVSLILPLKLSPLLLIGFILHYLANGGFVIVYFLKKKNTRLS